MPLNRTVFFGATPKTGVDGKTVGGIDGDTAGGGNALSPKSVRKTDCGATSSLG